MNIGICYNCLYFDIEPINKAIRLAQQNDDQINTIYFFRGRGYADLPPEKSLLKKIKKIYNNIQAVVLVKDSTKQQYNLSSYIDIVPSKNWRPIAEAKANKHHTLVHVQEEEEYDWSY